MLLHQRRKAAAEALGYELLVSAPDSESDYASQVQLVEDMIARGVDGIIICAINTDAIVTAVKKANEAGIPVVMFNVQDELADGKVDCYVTYDQREGGAKVADYMAEVVNGAETNVAIIEGLPSEHTRPYGRLLRPRRREVPQHPCCRVSERRLGA